MSAAQAPPEVCPRCEGQLWRNHDERLCPVHGTVYTPPRAWDVPSVDNDGFGPQGMRKRGPRGFGAKVPWTDEERRTWETWQEGDPVPGEEEDIMEGQNNAPRITSAEQLAAACQARIAEIDRRTAIIAREMTLLRLEKNKLQKVASLLGSKDEGSRECPECGRGFTSVHAVTVHRSKAYGVLSPRAKA